MSEFREEVAQLAWETYKKAVGGKSFNGDPLPGWEEMVTDEQKVKIVDAWRSVAQVTIQRVTIKAGRALVSDLQDVVDDLRTSLDEAEA